MFLFPAGKLFYAVGAATLNDLSPTVVKNLPLGRINAILLYLVGCLTVIVNELP